MTPQKNRTVMIGVLIVVVLFLLIDPFGIMSGGRNVQKPSVSREAAEIYAKALAAEAKPAAPTVLGLFDRHRLVVTGYYSFGFIREEFDFIRDLVPALPGKGVTDVAVDFLLTADQAAVDKLMAATSFDEQAARDLLVKRHALKSSLQQIAILQAIWQLNHPTGQSAGSKLRVVSLDIEYDTAYAASHENPNESAIIKKILFNGLHDVAYAKTVTKEILDKGRKALLFVQRESTVAGFVEQAYKLFVDSYGLGDNRRMARILAEANPGVLAAVQFYAPWPNNQAQAPTGYPANGLVEAALTALASSGQPTMPFALDLEQGTFGKIDIQNSAYNQTQPLKMKDRDVPPAPPIAIKFRDFASVYVVLGRIQALHSCAAIPGLVTEANKAQVAKFLPPQSPVKDDPAQLNKLIADNFERAAQVLALFK